MPLRGYIEDLLVHLYIYPYKSQGCYESFKMTFGIHLDALYESCNAVFFFPMESVR